MKSDNKLLIFMAAACFFTGLLFSLDDGEKMPAFGYAAVLAFVFFYNAFLWASKAAAERKRAGIVYSVMGLAVLVLMHAVYYVRGLGEEKAVLLLLAGAALFLIVLFALYALAEKGINDNVILAVIFAGFLLRWLMAVTCQAHLIQNDGGMLALHNYGHLGYTYALYSTGRLPTDPPMEFLQYYQPPLHYAIQALLLRIYEFFGIGIEQGDETLQLAAVFYMSASLILLNKIGKKVNCPDWGRFGAVGIAAFLPMSVHMGQANNNDQLALMFMLLALYCTLKWHEDASLKNILWMAVNIGLAMSAKLSGALAAPPMAVLMLWKAWQERRHWQRYLKQFACFGAVAFPLGLWHSIYYYFKYDMPFGYVARIDINADIYIGQHTGWERFSHFREALERPYIDFITSPDYNIPVTFTKYLAFNELHCYGEGTMKILGASVFWMTAAMLLLCTAAFVLLLFQKRYSFIHKVFFATGILVSMASFVKFCYEYPYTCSMNTRYVMAAIFMMLLVAGMSYAECFAGKNSKALRTAGGFLFCVAAVYMLCCMLLVLNLIILLF